MENAHKVLNVFSVFSCLVGNNKNYRKKVEFMRVNKVSRKIY